MRLEHWRYTIPIRLRSMFSRARVEQELSEEFQFHLDLQTAQGIAEGKTPEQARYAALRAMEGTERHKEACRDARRMNLADNIRRDLQYAVRGLAREPGFTAVMVTTLSLGIGANTAIFSLVETALLKPLPVKSPEHLYLVANHVADARMNWSYLNWPYSDYASMRDHNSVFQGLAVYTGGLQSIGVRVGNSSAPGAEPAYGVFVSGNYFDVLGVSPVLGHDFTAADDHAPGAAPYVVLSHSYWRTHFVGDPKVIGKKLSLNAYPFTVIGVTPPGFSGLDVASQPNMFIPITMYRSTLRHESYGIAIIGRARGGCFDEEGRSRVTSNLQRSKTGGTAQQG